MNLQPVTLSLNHVRLEPLAMRHFDDLARFNGDASLWRYMAFGDLLTQERLTRWIQEAMAEPAQGTGFPFAIVDTASNSAVGSTSLYDISGKNKRLEIGRTWIGKPFQRTAINTEGKYLLLRHCFETIGCNRVQLKTDARNVRSQAAIERLGAVREGTLRSHMVMPDGFLRDTVMYSIIAPEWPEVRERLEVMLTAAGQRSAVD